MPEARFDLVDTYDAAPQSDWFHACRSAKKPFVVVRTSEKTADVMWDYVTLPPIYDSILIAHERYLKEQAIAIFQKHASVDSSIRAKPTMIFFDNLPIPNAKEAANELYMLIETLVENPQQATVTQFAARAQSVVPTPSLTRYEAPSLAVESSTRSPTFDLIAAT